MLYADRAEAKARSVKPRRTSCRALFCTSTEISQETGFPMGDVAQRSSVLRLSLRITAATAGAPSTWLVAMFS